ncbi:Ig-like domain-containing protein [uncultured Vibrio sp.]|uniref:Ig-like domain-containing protein n=1 Tax=uncultured Vibrio sp. TaxID=114054 RepID=UPI0026184AB3|nr:Ig-like domain-containing protein [uncultured Vibrio sp.]
MNKYFKALFAMVVFPLLILLTGCKSDSGFTDPSAILERIEIEASPIATIGTSQLTLAAGNKQPFEAVGYYADGSSRPLTDLTLSNWHTSDVAMGTFETSGVLTAGKTTGDVTIYATHAGITSNKVTVNITDAVITAIQVTPSPVNVAKGQSQQLTATATYSDGTTSGVSNLVAWTPVDTDTATVTEEGELSGVEVGDTTLTATIDGITSNTVTVNVTDAVITEIQVTPSPVEVAIGLNQQLTATATYSDGTTSDVSNSVAWTPVDTDTATVTRRAGYTGS